MSHFHLGPNREASPFLRHRTPGLAWPTGASLVEVDVALRTGRVARAWRCGVPVVVTPVVVVGA